MADFNVTPSIPQQIADLNGKLATMRQNRADFFTRKEALTKDVATAREAIATAKAAGKHGVVDQLRAEVNRLLNGYDGLNFMRVPPPGEESVQYKAIQQRIADLEAEEKKSANTAIIDPNDHRILNARAIRQAATGAELAAQNATASRLAAEAIVNGQAELDGTV